MNTYPVVRSTLALSVLLLGSRAANAACVISGARPTVPLPTMAAGQQFSFIATADCETLRFRVPGTTFVKIPKPGRDLKSRDNTYKVVLTDREWTLLVDESDTTFTWSIIGTTSAGETTRVTTTNELITDEGVTLNLSMADGKLLGEESSDQAGGSVSGAGDVNGDGNNDLLVGAAYNMEGGAYAGAAYLVLGPVSGDLDLSLADAKLVGEESFDFAGTSVSGAGDLNNDGNADLLVGAYHESEGGYGAGAAYVVLGPVTGDLDLSLADAKLVGEEGYDAAGGTVSGAGDVNGDGNDDVLVGASSYAEVGTPYGAAYLMLGPVTGTLDLSLADAKLVGAEVGDVAGSVCRAGDVDGDGHVDLLVGAPGNDEGGFNAGAAYFVLGPVTGTLDLSLADAKLVGEEDWEYAGLSVSGAGDVDDDGHDDLLVGAPADPIYAPSSTGAAYLVLGSVSGTLDLSLADAKLIGEDAGDLAGFSVSGVGDVNVDGNDDLLIGAYSNPSTLYTGAAYLVLGPVTGNVELASADAKFVGEGDTDVAGISVSGTADVEGDLLIGALGNDETGTDAGAAYVVDGGGLF